MACLTEIQACFSPFLLTAPSRDGENTKQSSLSPFKYKKPWLIQVRCTHTCNIFTRPFWHSARKRSTITGIEREGYVFYFLCIMHTEGGHLILLYEVQWQFAKTKYKSRWTDIILVLKALFSWSMAYIKGHDLIQCDFLPSQHMDTIPRSQCHCYPWCTGKPGPWVLHYSPGFLLAQSSQPDFVHSKKPACRFCGSAVLQENQLRWMPSKIHTDPEVKWSMYFFKKKTNNNFIITCCFSKKVVSYFLFSLSLSFAILSLQ